MTGRAKPGQPKSQAKQTVGKRVGNGAGKGDGWGGPAQGESTSRIKPGDPDGIQARASDPVVLADKEAKAALLEDHLFSLAFNAERQETQVSASNAWLDRVKGKPIARTVTTTVDDVSQLSDLELTAEIARLDREIGSVKAGSGEAEAGKQASRVPPVH